MTEFKTFSQDLERIVYSKEQIEEMLDRLGKEITECYQDSVPNGR